MGGRMLIPYASDQKVRILPASQAEVVPVTNVAVAQAELAAGVEGVELTCSTAPATGLIDWDLEFEGSLSAGLGIQLTDMVIAYSVLGQALTGPPAVAISAVTFAPIGTAGAAPVVAAYGGTLTATPSPLRTAVSTAGQQYTGKIALGTQAMLNADLQKLVARLSVPLAVGGSFLLLGAFLHYTVTLAQ